MRRYERTDEEREIGREEVGGGEEREIDTERDRERERSLQLIPSVIFVKFFQMVYSLC